MALSDIHACNQTKRKRMPKDDGLVADVQSRASGALYNWNRRFNDQSVAYYRARHREDIELSRAPGTRRYSRRQLLSQAATRSCGPNVEETRSIRGGRSGLVDPVALGWGGKLRCVAGREAAPSFLARRRQATVCSAELD